MKKLLLSFLIGALPLLALGQTPDYCVTNNTDVDLKATLALGLADDFYIYKGQGTVCQPIPWLFQTSSQVALVRAAPYYEIVCHNDTADATVPITVVVSGSGGNYSCQWGYTKRK